MADAPQHDAPQFDVLWQRMDGETLAPTCAPSETLTGGATRAPRTLDGPLVPLPRLALAGDPSVEPEYVLGELIGRGGTARVYAAEHRPLGRTVAIKIPHARPVGADVLDPLITEARVAGRLAHPHIVPVHALGTDANGAPLLVMKRIEGAAWSALIGEPQHAIWSRWPADPVERAVQVTLRVADALVSAHSAQVLHRDVKPANVVLGPVGEVYLVDWGLALPIGDDGVAQAEGVAGTPAYMAPEMFDTGARLDARSDVYLLGATLYEALAGQRARRGGNLAAVVLEACSGPPPLPAVVPARLVSIVRRAMAVAPGERYADVEALRAALQRFLDHRPSIALAARAAAAHARLDAGRTARVDPDALDAELAAARFGYRAALSAWPSNPEARAGLQNLLESVIAHDLERGEVAAARRALAELPEPRPQLAAAVAQAADLVEQDRAELAAARTERARLDTVADSRSRVRGLYVVVPLILLGPIMIGIMRIVDEAPLDAIPPTRAVGPFALAAVFQWWLRKGPADGPGALFNYRLLRLMQALIVVVGASWLLGMINGLGVDDVVRTNLLVIAVAFGVGGVTFARPLGWLTLLAAVGLVVCQLAPIAAELVLGVVLALGVFLLERAWHREARQRG